MGVYFKINASTSSSQYDGADNDGTLISFLRLTELKMDINLATDNVQYILTNTLTTTHGDIEYSGTGSDYTLLLCNATASTFNYGSFNNNQVLDHSTEGC